MTAARLKVRAVALLVGAAVALAGCGTTVQTTAVPKASRPACGTVKLAANAWVGYQADAAVVTYLLRNKLGCDVEQKRVNEETAWQGFADGTVDVILENRGHDDLKKKYIDEQKVAVEDGETGNRGVTGWYVPPWLAKAYPDVLHYDNLNTYADKFKTAESKNNGQLLDGDPSSVNHDEALVKNLHLNFTVVYAGSEDALIAAFRQAEQKKTWLIGYFYEPQWFLSQMQLVQVQLPPYTPGCDADPVKVACGYQPYDLDKIVSSRFADSGTVAADFVKNFQWTNDDQNTVANYLAVDKMKDDDAAKKWVDANPDKVNAWLKGLT